MPRFAILEHDYPHRHWDLFLEAGDFSRSWRLAEEPHFGPPIRAEAIGNHRLLYLDYEGPVSGGRGSVKRWDWGAYTGSVNDEKSLAVVIIGQRIRGQLKLEWESGSEWRVAFASQHEGNGE